MFFLFKILNKIRDVVGNFSILGKLNRRQNATPPIALPFPCCSCCGRFWAPFTCRGSLVRRFWKTSGTGMSKATLVHQVMIQAVTELHPQTLEVTHFTIEKGHGWLNHPKKVTAWITRHGWSLPHEARLHMWHPTNIAQDSPRLEGWGLGQTMAQTSFSIKNTCCVDWKWSNVPVPSNYQQSSPLKTGRGPQ